MDGHYQRKKLLGFTYSLKPWKCSFNCMVKAERSHLARLTLWCRDNHFSALPTSSSSCGRHVPHVKPYADGFLRRMAEERGLGLIMPVWESAHSDVVVGLLSFPFLISNGNQLK